MVTQLQEPLTMKQKVRTFLFEWSRFPIDYWWRKKYNIPFGSKEHRAMNFIDMLIEYEENLLMNEPTIDPDLEFEESDFMSQKEIDEEYDKIEI